MSKRPLGSASPGLKFLGILGLVGLGATIAFGRKPGDIVTGQSGTSWRVVLVSQASGNKQYDVYSATSGLRVLRYSQTDADRGSRKLVAAGEGADQALVRLAASDFDVPLPA